MWRFLTRDGWWRGHPFSISSAPNGSWLRITIKELGDWSALLKTRVSVGTRVFVEGPYGILTGARRTRQRVLLIAGGIGITPLRALLEALPARPGDLTLLYRVRDEHDIVFRDELEALARIRGAEVQYLPGRRRQAPRSLDPLGPAGLQALVPDVRDRDVYVCGPVPMMQHVESSLRRLGLPRAPGPRGTVRLLIRAILSRLSESSKNRPTDCVHDSPLAGDDTPRPRHIHRRSP